MRVIYIDIDSLRADHLGCYGYGRPTSPNIDQLANVSTVFRNAFVSSSPCMPSRAALLSGRFGISNGVLTHWGVGANFRFPGIGHTYFDEAPTLTRYLRQQGYSTVSFSSFMDRHQAFWFGAGWEQMHTHTLKQGEENADEVNAAVLPWLREHALDTENLFLHVQYWDPHRNYTVDRSWVDKVSDAPLPDWLTDDVVAAHQKASGPFTAQELFTGETGSPVPTMPDSIDNLADAHTYFDGYDGAIRFLDDQIGELLATLEQLGILDDTAIVIGADHGEAMGEGGVYGDHVSASEAVHNVPMIVKWPGTTPGTRDELIYQLDLLPTLCELLGVDVPPGWDGESFAGGVQGRPDWSGRGWLVWDHALYSCQRVVRTPDWLYQRSYHPGLYEFEDVALFDIVRDRHQTTNLASVHPDVVTDLDHRLTAWREAGMASGQPDPMEEILASGGPFRYITPDRWADRLRRHGRREDADRLDARIRDYAHASVA